MKLSKRLAAFALSFALLISPNLVGGVPAVAATDCIDWTVDEDGEFQCVEWVNTDPEDPVDAEAPTGLVVAARTSSSIKLAWDPYDSATGWVIAVSYDNAESWKELVVQNPDAFNGLTLNQIKPATAMWVRVAALTPERSAFSDSEFATTKGAKAVTVKVVDFKGKPVKGGQITWRMVDNSAKSAKTYGLTDGGVNVFPAAPAGPVDVTLKNALTADGALVSGTWRTTLGFANPVLRLPEVETSKHTVKVVLENGLPVIGAKVSIPKPEPIWGEDCIESKTVEVWVEDGYEDEYGDWVDTGYYEEQEYCTKFGRTIIGYEGGVQIDSTTVVNGFSFVSQVGPYEGTTDINGNFTISGFFTEETEATVTYNDSVIIQEQVVSLTNATTRVELEYMPWVDVQTSYVTVDPNQLASIYVNIQDAVASQSSFTKASVSDIPFTQAAASKKGIRVTLVAPKGAPKGKCAAKLTGVTDSKGKLTLKVCALKSGVYTLKTAGAASVETVRVQVKGTAPMPAQKVTAKSVKLGQVDVAWAAPVFDGKSKVTSYVITATAKGKKTVTKTVSGSLRKATLTGLSNATTYTITVVAKNSKGSSEPVTVTVPVA